MLNPLERETALMPGISLIFSLNSLLAATVLSKDAPGGISMFAKIIPLSSLGTNPVDMVLDDQIIPTVHAIRKVTVIHLCLYKNPRELIYFLVVALKAVLNLLKNPPSKPFRSFFSSTGFRNKALNAGLNVNAFTAEIIIATINVTPNCS